MPQMTRFDVARQIRDFLVECGYHNVDVQDGFQDCEGEILCVGEIFLSETPDGDTFNVQVSGPWNRDGDPTYGWEDQREDGPEGWAK